MSLRRTFFACLLATVLAAMTITLNPKAFGDTPTEVFAVPASGQFTLSGLGYGHGHGLSQYGAKGAAEQGLSAAQILNFYYPGTSTAGGGNVTLRVDISVASPSEVWIGASSTLGVRDLANGNVVNLTQAGVESWVFFPRGTGTDVYAYYAGAGHLAAQLAGGAEVFDTAQPLALGTGGSSVNRYWGMLDTFNSSDNVRRLVNVIGLDNYVRGVVPREMPTSWSAAAVQSQAVAARTYAMYSKSTAGSRYYDICDTTYCQVYGGVNAETAGGNSAVAATGGQYLTYGGTPAFTQFSSSNGGWTSYGGKPYLDHHADPYDPATMWTVNLSTSALQQRYPQIGQLTQIGVISREGGGTWNGRVLSMQLVGTAGQVTITGYSFQAIYNLRSNWFQIQGMTSTTPPTPPPPPTNYQQAPPVTPPPAAAPTSTTCRRVNTTGGSDLGPRTVCTTTTSPTTSQPRPAPVYRARLSGS